MNGVVACDFVGNGLTNNVKNHIEKVVWNLGGNSNNQICSDNLYRSERSDSVYEGNQTEWTGNVALAYLSDYAYGADFRTCSVVIGNYSSVGCYDNDWLLYKINIYGEGDYYWTLTNNLENNNSSWWISTYGSSDTEYVNSGWNGVIPTFYLKSSVTISSGNGSRTNPYKVG